MIIKNQGLSKTEWLAFVLIFIATILSFIGLNASAFHDNYLKVYFLDVGQGDAEFIQAPNGNQILIDGGPDGKIIQELGKIMPFNDHSIDLVILTHPHADHVNGLIEVLKRYQVDKIIENDVPYDSPEHTQWENDKTKTEVIEAHTGQVIDLGNNITLNILFPDQSGLAPSEKIKNVHDFMVVSRLDYGQERVLFMGDTEAKLEHRLVLTYGADLGAQFLKIGHHGSKTSTTEELLNTVKPIRVFIEVGAKNKYGHPSQQTIDRLESSGIKYYRTDINGRVELDMDGQSYKITAEH